ncbi:MAG: peptidylprolyl isomerase [Porticoccaceae bacterium]
MSGIKIEPGSQVTLHFELTLEDGEVLDSNFDGKPARLIVGDGNLPAGFERLLAGMEAEEQHTFEVPPEQAFGQRNPANLQEIKRDQFAADMELSPGLVISFADAAKGELPGVVSEVGDTTVVVDFNHPLAGRTLGFRVHILNVEDVNGVQDCVQGNVNV